MTDDMVAATLVRIDGMLDDIAEANRGISASLGAPPPRGPERTALVVLLDDHRKRA